MSLLIQRLGRCWRFGVDADGRPIWRPPWSQGPTLVVLDPVNLDSVVPTPPEWDSVYPSFEVAATHQVLVERSPELAVPGDVDGVVQQVHDAQASGVPGKLRGLWDEQYGEKRAHAQLARMAAIESAETITDLSRLTDPEVSDLDVSTRLGMDTARLIPRYTSPDGRHCLDAEHQVEWPSARPKDDTVRQFINASITCPRSWAEAEGLQTNPTWSRTPMLRDAFILPAPEYGRLAVDGRLGLVRRKKGTP
jgi:CRISPR-associated endonuclease/helicase Cas3